MDLLYRVDRIYLPTETLGSWYPIDLNVVLCKTMELPWLNNQRSVSCIPEGVHRCIREAFTVKHPYPHLRFPDVKGRVGILAHRITYVKHLKGCVGIGQAFKDFNKDGVPDIAGSTDAMQALYDTVPDEFFVLFQGKPGYKQLHGPSVEMAV